MKFTDSTTIGDSEYAELTRNGLTVIGIDPGVRDTGIVGMTFRNKKLARIEYHVVSDGLRNMDKTLLEIEKFAKQFPAADRFAFSERYENRGTNFNHDLTMMSFDSQLKVYFDRSVRLIPNMGIKKVITDSLLKSLELYHFKQKTNHSDLRSAARIGLLGMAKNKTLNRVLSDAFRSTMEEPATLI